MKQIIYNALLSQLFQIRARIQVKIDFGLINYANFLFAFLFHFLLLFSLYIYYFSLILHNKFLMLL